MDETEPAPEWQRHDGVTIYQAGDGWGFRRGAVAFSSCPCCGLSMQTPEMARLVSERVFPSDRQPPMVQATK